jgi:hypothetical protein
MALLVRSGNIVPPQGGTQNLRRFQRHLDDVNVGMKASRLFDISVEIKNIHRIGR